MGRCYGVKDCHENKPVEMLNLGGIHQKRRLHVHVAVVMGDQKSQDCVCGRKSINGGNAGRVHRACMCSAFRASDARTRTIDSGCRLVSVDVTRKLNKVALIPLETTVCGPAQ